MGESKKTLLKANQFHWLTGLVPNPLREYRKSCKRSRSLPVNLKGGHCIGSGFRRRLHERGKRSRMEGRENRMGPPLRQDSAGDG
jgi:hypothetical protein